MTESEMARQMVDLFDVTHDEAMGIIGQYRENQAAQRRNRAREWFNKHFGELE